MNSNRLGIIAGGGRLPILVAQGAKQKNMTVVVLGLEGHDSAPLEQLADSYETIPIGNLSGAISFFRNSGVQTVALCGQVDHKHLFNPADFDDLMKQVIAAPDNRAEAILGRIVKVFAQHGLQVTGIAPLVKDNLAGEGLLAGPEPDEQTASDITFSFDLARQVAELNIGQSILVARGTVLAVEALEGTDRMIKRSGVFNVTGATLAKVPLRNKDTRFDLPVVGSQTIRALAEINAAALVIASEKTILIDPEEIAALAEKEGISLIARRLED